MHDAPHVMPSMMSEHHQKHTPIEDRHGWNRFPEIRLELTGSRADTNATGSTPQAKRVCIYAHCIAHALALASCELSLLYVTCC